MWLKTNATPIYKGFNKGASIEELNGMEAKLGVKLSQDFRDLYSFHNGQSEDSLEGSSIAEWFNKFVEQVLSGEYVLSDEYGGLVNRNDL